MLKVLYNRTGKFSMDKTSDLFAFPGFHSNFNTEKQIPSAAGQILPDFGTYNLVHNTTRDGFCPLKAAGFGAYFDDKSGILKGILETGQKRP